MLLDFCQVFVNFIFPISILNNQLKYYNFLNLSSLLKPNSCCKTTNKFLSLEILSIKKLEIEKTKPTYGPTFKIEISKVGLVFSIFNFQFFFCNRDDTIQYHDGFRSRKLGQASLLLVFLTPKQALSSHPRIFIMILWESMNFHPD